MSSGLPALIAKALADTGYDLVTPAEEGWFIARTSGAQAREGRGAGAERGRRAR